MNQRSTIIDTVLSRLASGLKDKATIGLLKPVLPYPDLTQRAQITVHLLGERQASELQSKGSDKGVTYGPTSNKNLSPNPLDRRVLQLQLEIEVEDSDAARLMTRIDEVITQGEILIEQDDVPTPWQFYIPYKAEFSFNKQVETLSAKVTCMWEFFYQVERPEEPAGVLVKSVYLGPKGGDYKLIYESSDPNTPPPSL